MEYKNLANEALECLETKTEQYFQTALMAVKLSENTLASYK